jgi:hypothetical protein
VVTEVNKEVKENRDGKAIKSVDEMELELHDRTGCLRRNDARLWNLYAFALCGVYSHRVNVTSSEVCEDWTKGSDDIRYR